jgi:hypothetical protein
MATLDPIEIDTGPEARATADGLYPVKKPRFERAWLDPGADFSHYTAVMLEPVTIAYERTPRKGPYHGLSSANFALSDSQLQELQRSFHDEFAQRIAKTDAFVSTASPGPAVLRIDAAIIDLVVKAPTEPMNARDRVYTTSTGEMTLVLEVRDSLSGRVLARAEDRREVRAAGAGGAGDFYFSNAATNAGAVRGEFRRWAEILGQRLDQLHASAPLPAAAETR